MERTGHFPTWPRRRGTAPMKLAIAARYCCLEGLNPSNRSPGRLSRPRHRCCTAPIDVTTFHGHRGQVPLLRSADQRSIESAAARYCCLEGLNPHNCSTGRLSIHRNCSTVMDRTVCYGQREIVPCPQNAGRPPTEAACWQCCCCRHVASNTVTLTRRRTQNTHSTTDDYVTEGRFPLMLGVLQ